MERKLFGKGFDPEASIRQAPSADHILGAHLEYGDDGKPQAVALHYKHQGEPVEIRMDWLNAMFLLSVLKGMQIETGQPFPDDPRAPSHR